MKTKKLVSIITAIILIVTLASCGTQPKEDITINVAVLNGTTGFGMAHLMNETKDVSTNPTYNFSVETDATVIRDALINGSVDIAAVPTNLASVLYNKTNGGVKVLALNTLGVLYVVENGSSITSLSDLEGKTVYCPATNPEYIFKYICSAAGVNVEISTEYAQPAALMNAVAGGIVDIAVLPEPVLSVATGKNANLRVALDLTEIWENTTGNNSLVQGCLVARTEFIECHSDEISEFLKKYKASIEFLNSNPAQAAAMTVDLGIYAGNAAIAEKAIPKCNIVYIDGESMKAPLSDFLSAMLGVSAASIGGAVPDDNFYYISK